MKKIAILRCLHSNDVCTGAACLRAFNSRSASFACYAGEELELVAYFSCDGCGDAAFHNDRGMAEKLAMVKRLAPYAVHVGVCTLQRIAGSRVRCPKIKQLTEELAAAGIKIIDGTH